MTLSFETGTEAPAQVGPAPATLEAKTQEEMGASSLEAGTEAPAQEGPSKSEKEAQEALD